MVVKRKELGAVRVRNKGKAESKRERESGGKGNGGETNKAKKRGKTIRKDVGGWHSKEMWEEWKKKGVGVTKKGIK
jgi:hypothetical protein